jgi:hypothetical protein
MDALQALCRKRLGFDPASLSPSQLENVLPDILEAVYDEAKSIDRQQKAVGAYCYAICETVPNAGIIRDERVSAFPQVHAESGFRSDPNRVFDSAFPFLKE